MHSEFYNVDLDRLRYSLVWEGHRTLAAALDVRPSDELLVICSAGCNALNALLLGARRVTAIDLNPVQLHLLELKRYLILHHPAPVLRALLIGQAHPDSLRLLPPLTPSQVQAFWQRYPAAVFVVQPQLVQQPVHQLLRQLTQGRGYREEQVQGYVVLEPIAGLHAHNE